MDSQSFLRQITTLSPSSHNAASLSAAGVLRCVAAETLPPMPWRLYFPAVVVLCVPGSPQVEPAAGSVQASFASQRVYCCGEGIWWSYGQFARNERSDQFRQQHSAEIRAGTHRFSIQDSTVVLHIEVRTFSFTAYRCLTAVGVTVAPRHLLI